MRLIRQFASTDIPHPMEPGIHYDGYLGWDLTEENIHQLRELEACHKTLTIEIIESELPTGIWTINRMFPTNNL